MSRTQTWNIEIDTRERVPLVFPAHIATSRGLDPTTVALTSSRETLTSVDYRLSSHPTACVIERKGSIHEICTNLTSPKRRPAFVLECQRLRAQCSHPILLFEGDPNSLLTQRGPQQQHPSYLLSLLLDLLFSYRITPLFLRSDSLPSRRAVGEVAALCLIRAAILQDALHKTESVPSPPSATAVQSPSCETPSSR